MHDAWAWLVEAIEDGRYDHMVEEYHNDLDSRKVLHVVLAAVPDEICDRLAGWLLPLDQRFDMATVVLARPIAGSSDLNSPRAAWRGYWRIPKALGPELRAALVRRGLV
jgi:hypothetical protein